MPAPHVPEHPQDPEQDSEVDRGDEVEEATGDGGADPAGDGVQGGAVVLDLPGQRTYPDAEQERQREDDRGVAEGEEEPDRQRPLAVGHQLAGGVVDRGDVVGVEGVAQTQGVGGDPEADAEHLAVGPEVVVPRGDDRDQSEPADHVQPDDDAGHAGHARPLPWAERPADAGEPCRGRGVDLGSHGGILPGGGPRQRRRGWMRLRTLTIPTACCKILAGDNGLHGAAIVRSFVIDVTRGTQRSAAERSGGFTGASARPRGGGTLGDEAGSDRHI